MFSINKRNRNQSGAFAKKMPDYHKSNGASVLAGHKQEKAMLTVLEQAGSPVGGMGCVSQCKSSASPTPRPRH